MNIILIMIPMALALMVAAGIAFFWAANHGQFEDMSSPSLLPMSDNLPEDDEDDDDWEESNSTNNGTSSEKEKNHD